MHAFILAGGFATRLWPLTEKRAKPLLPLAGKPLLTHIVENIPTGTAITVSTNAAFKEGFEQWKLEEQRDNVTILIEQTKSDDQKLGALGAVAQWIRDEHIDDDVLLLTGDNYFGFRLSDFVAAAHGNAALLAAHDIGDLEQAKRFGTVLLDTDGKTITGFEEKPLHPRTTFVSTGCYVLPRWALPILIEYASEHPDNVGGIFEELLRREKTVECFTFHEPWFDIGSFEAYIDATAALVGDRILASSSASCTNCDTTGSVVLGEGSTVENSELTNVVLFENCTVRNCTLENCILDNNCHLEGVDLSKKMLRENTQLIRN